MTIKRAEFERIVTKYGFKTRNSGDRLAWLEHNGRTIVRTRRSNQAGELPAAHLIRQQLKLDDDQLRKAISCSLDLPGYLKILAQKGVL